MYKLYIIFALVVFISACDNESSQQIEPESSSIKISKEQFNANHMRMVSPKMNLLESRIHFSGKIIPTAQGIIKISAPVEGIITYLNVQKGQTITKNSPIAKIGGQALIDLQQKFATASARLPQLKAKYKRVKKLYNEEIKTENEYLIAESEYQSLQIDIKALMLKLQLIGLDPKDIQKGNFASNYTLKSPMDGQVNELNLVQGQYVSAEDEVVELINHAQRELQVSLFENDFNKIKLGQIIYFNALKSTDFHFQASISRIGTALNAKSNTLECFANISNDNGNKFALNQLIHGEIVVQVDSTLTIPKEATSNEGNNTYIIALIEETKDAYHFEKVMVKTGKSDKYHVEVLDLGPDIQILVDQNEY
jgi:cobalt-zinc-cadmium efflux system membrane fusion protein